MSRSDPSEKISDWLRKTVSLFPIPLVRKRYRLKIDKVSLGLEIYLLRYARIPYVEYCIYWPEFAERFFEDMGAPIFCERMRRPTRESDGFRSDLSLSDFAERKDFFCQEIVRQGEEIFHRVNSPLTLHSLYNLQIPELQPEAHERARWESQAGKIEGSGLLAVVN